MYIFEPKSYFPKPNQVLFLLKTNQTATDSQHEPHDDKVGVCLFVLGTVIQDVYVTRVVCQNLRPFFPTDSL